MRTVLGSRKEEPVRTCLGNCCWDVFLPFNFSFCNMFCSIKQLVALFPNPSSRPGEGGWVDHLDLQKYQGCV